MKKSGFYSPITRRGFIKLISVEMGVLAVGGCKAVAAAGPTQLATEVTSASRSTAQSQSTPTSKPAVIDQPAATSTMEARGQPTPTSQPPATSLVETTPIPQNTPAPPAEFLPDISRVGQSFTLPQPDLSQSLPLMQALAQRHSSRSFRSDELSTQVLGDLLWAGFGVNRPESGKRTAPSALNMQDIHIYMAVRQGVWHYEASTHSLKAILIEDVRALTHPAGDAPIQLIYVSRYPAGYSEADMLAWSWAHSGFIAQNVYLYCSAAGLATVVRSSLTRPPLAEKMGLGQNEHITLVQAVGMGL